MVLPFSCEHRPYPPVARPWVMWQTWCDLLFAHWPIAVEELRPLVPDVLDLDTFQGTGWISIVPFRMENVRPRFCCNLPGLSAFPELNVRTYVRVQDRPGVYFLTLDAANPVAVRVARRYFHLPYRDARMMVRETAGWIHYRSQRTDRLGPSAELVGRYRPIGPVLRAQPGSLDEWLTERYCMYPVDSRGQVYRGEIHHAPWPIQRAEAEFEINTMAQGQGWPLPTAPPLLHFSRRIDVVVWRLEKLARGHSGRF